MAGSDSTTTTLNVMYNASYGNCVDDGLYALFSSKAVITAEALKLKEEWGKFLEGHGPDAKILDYCHSAGAIHVRKALENFPEIRNRIICSSADCAKGIMFRFI